MASQPLVWLLPPIYNLKWDGRIHSALLDGLGQSSWGAAAVDVVDATKPAVFHFPGPNKPWVRSQQLTAHGKLWLRVCAAASQLD